MSDERAIWIRHSYYLALLTAGFHFLQFVASSALWVQTNSAALASFGLDGLISSFAALALAVRIRRSFETLGEHWLSRGLAYAYMLAAMVALALGAIDLWWARRPARSILGIAVAALS